MEFEIGKGMVNIDGADIAAAIDGAKRIAVFIEESHDIHRVSKKIAGAKSLVVAVHGGKNITIQDCQRIVERLSVHVRRSADIVWGASVGKKKLLIIAVW